MPVSSTVNDIEGANAAPRPAERMKPSSMRMRGTPFASHRLGSSVGGSSPGGDPAVSPPWRPRHRGGRAGKDRAARRDHRAKRRSAVASSGRCRNRRRAGVRRESVAQEFELIDRGQRIRESARPWIEISRIADIGRGNHLRHRTPALPPRNDLAIVGQAPSGIEGHAEAGHLAAGHQGFKANLARHRVDVVGFFDEAPRD